MRLLAVYRAVLLAAGLLVVAVLPSYAASRARTGPDSFLQWEAYTAEEFMTQVESDAVLRKRLAKHFRIPEAQIVSYLRAELEEVTFTEDGWGVVYGVTKTGRIYPIRFRFKEGTKALGLDGIPFFRLPCGNPIDVWVWPGERGTYGFELPLAPRIEVPLELAVFVAPEEYVLPLDIPRAPVFRVPVTTESRRFIPFWWPRGGGAPERPPPPPPPVPEPATVLLFGAGLAVFGARFIRRRG